MGFPHRSATGDGLLWRLRGGVSLEEAVHRGTELFAGEAGAGRAGEVLGLARINRDVVKFFLLLAAAGDRPYRPETPSARASGCDLRAGFGYQTLRRRGRP